MDKTGYDRVTEVLSIIKDDIDIVRKIRGEEFLEERANIGRACHKAVEQYAIFKMGLQDFDEELVLWNEPEEVVKKFTQAKKWIDQNVDEIVYSEKQVYLDAYKVRGTCDLVARIKGDTRLTLIDFKFVATISKKTRLQLSGYQMALFAENINCERRLAVQIGTDDHRAVEFDAHKTDEMLFLNALNLYRHLR